MKQNLDKYQIDSDKEKTLWSDCLFVFDSSSLLNFYDYSVDTRKNIFDTTLKVIKERLWIPQHVEFEFLKNKEVTFKKPISKYQQLLTEHLVKIDEQYKQLRNKSKKENKHPHISENVFESFDIEFDKFKEKLKSEIDERISEIEKLSEKDDVSIAFNKYFKVGKEFNYQQLTEIAKEGEFRYKYSIPPGYKDLEEKSGFQIFGDLIIWKQIIEYAKAINKPIVLITDDVKEDWWNLKKRGEPERPREELIDEIEFHANVPFWMYTTIEFLEKSQKYLDSKIKANSIMEVRNATFHYYVFISVKNYPPFQSRSIPLVITK
ncbi:MAG TPA: PIN-like domain-containing protein [Prolixibacteraceae bacterium]|nr:PIN-like domain-containing protein [Prolixibacteraceae bacterium]